MNGIRQRVGMVALAVRISRSPEGVSLSLLNPAEVAFLEEKRVVAVCGDRVRITGIAREALSRRGYDLEERKIKAATDLSGMATSSRADHALPEIRGRKPGRFEHLAKCWECGAEPGCACRTEHDLVAMHPCDGRRPRVER